MNLGNALGKATVNITVTVETERDVPKPTVKTINVSGAVTDVYDFQSSGSDDYNGYAGRIQTCYSPTCERTSGKIFKVLVNLNMNPPAYMLGSTAYDDYTGMQSSVIWLLENTGL